MITLREPVITVDFQNNFIIAHKTNRKGLIDSELKEKFIPTIDSFWHTDKDKLDFFSVDENGIYFCQRRKLQHDFSTNTSYWKVYSFSGGSTEQALQLLNHMLAFLGVVREVKEIKIDKKIKEIDQNIIFFEERYLKKKREKNEMLALSDWRVLPDVVDSYPGEKDMWIKWREYIRSFLLKSPSDFSSEPNPGLAFFKWTHEIKYPMDPKNYRKLYPDGMLEDGVTPAPEFMDKNDPLQWVSTDSESSTDFIQSRDLSIYNLSTKFNPEIKKIKKNVLDLMKMMEVDTLVDFDWEKYYTEESEL